VAGGGQVSTDQAFQPIMVRVTDLSSPPNPVIAANVTFLTTVLRPEGTSEASGGGETDPTNPAMPVILQVTQTVTTTDLSGLASTIPSGGGFSAPVEVDVAVTAGISSLLDYPLEILPAFKVGSSAGGTGPPPIRTLPVRVVRPMEIQER